MRLRLLGGLLPLLAGCAVQSAPVPLASDSATYARMVGSWIGEYQSPETGGTGTIMFSLTAGDNHAHGDVVMTPRGARVPLRPYHPDGVPADPQATQSLVIQFVRAYGDSVTGTLAPYRDPACDCAIATTFAGRIAGATMAGTFTSYRRGARVPTTGTWRMQLTR